MKLKNIKPALLVFALLLVGSFSLFAVAQTNLSREQATFNDSDNDGLSDDEEKVYGTDPNKADTDGDGYSDGVEVKSGYNPLKAAPGDKVVTVDVSATAAVLGESTVADGTNNEESTTSKLSEKLTEFIKESDGKTGEVSVNDLDNIIQESIGSELVMEALPGIDESLIKIKKQDYAGLSEEARTKKEKEDAMNYLTSTMYILMSNAPTKITTDADVSSFTEQVLSQASSLLNGSANSMSFFDDLADRGQLTMEQLNEIEVPEKLVPTHKKGLQLALYSIELKKDVNIDVNDPMGLIVSLSKVQKVIEQGASYYTNMLTEFKKYGIGNATDEAPVANIATPVVSTTAPTTSIAATSPETTSGIVTTP